MRVTAPRVQLGRRAHRGGRRRVLRGHGARLFGTEEEPPGDALTRIEVQIGRRFPQLTLDGSPRAAPRELFVLLAGSDQPSAREDVAVGLAFRARAARAELSPGAPSSRLARVSAGRRAAPESPAGQDTAADLLRRARELGLSAPEGGSGHDSGGAPASADSQCSPADRRLGPEEARRCVSDYLDALLRTR